jgi:hypothetical protein
MYGENIFQKYFNVKNQEFIRNERYFETISVRFGGNIWP